MPLILAQADEAGFRMEIIDGLGVWEVMPSRRRHIEAEARIERSVRPDPDRGSDRGCHSYRDLDVRFPNDSLRRPDVAIFCRRPDEEDEAVTFVPEAVVVLDPYTGIVWHHRLDRPVERRQSPVDLVLRGGCLVTV